MLAWVAGGAIGLIPLNEVWGLGLATAAMLAAATLAIRRAVRMRGEVLNGRADASAGRPPSARPAGSAAKDKTAREYAAEAPTVAEFLRRGPAPPPARRASADGSTAPEPATVSTEATEGRGDDEAPPGFHIFRPSPPDDGVRDPRSGP
jgi:hypothetical protein